MLVGSVTISRRDFDAAIFVDGVLTDSARVHAAAWKAVFDTFLMRWARRHGLAFQPFEQALQKGIDPAAGAEALLNKLREVGVRTAVGSSSKKEASAAILEFGDLIALAWLGSLEPERAQTIWRVIRDAGCPVIVFRVQA